MEKSVIKSVFQDGNNITVSNWDSSGKILVSTVSTTGKIISNVFIDKQKTLDLIGSLKKFADELK